MAWARAMLAVAICVGAAMALAPPGAAHAAEGNATITLNAPEGATLENVYVQAHRIGRYADPTACTYYGTMPTLSNCGGVSVTSADEAVDEKLRELLEAHGVEQHADFDGAGNLARLAGQDDKAEALADIVREYIESVSIVRPNDWSEHGLTALSGTTQQLTVPGAGLYALDVWRRIPPSNEFLGSRLMRSSMLVGTRIEIARKYYHLGRQELGEATVKLPDVPQHGFEILKQDDRDETPLEGAGFKITSAHGKYGNFVKVWDEATGSWLPDVPGSQCEDDGNGTVFVTGEDGVARIPPLPAGTYVLCEVRMPEGFEGTTPLKFNVTVEDDGTITLRREGDAFPLRLVGSGGVTLAEKSAIPVVDATILALNIPNNRVHALPMTGGTWRPGPTAAAAMVILAGTAALVAALVRHRVTGAERRAAGDGGRTTIPS